MGEAIHTRESRSSRDHFRPQFLGILVSSPSCFIGLTIEPHVIPESRVETLPVVSPPELGYKLFRVFRSPYDLERMVSDFC
jgi:hypothetical protein